LVERAVALSNIQDELSLTEVVVDEDGGRTSSVLIGITAPWTEERLGTMDVRKASVGKTGVGQEIAGAGEGLD